MEMSSIPKIISLLYSTKMLLKNALTFSFLIGQWQKSMRYTVRLYYCIGDNKINYTKNNIKYIL